MIEGEENAFFCNCECQRTSGDGGRCYHVNFNWFEKFQRETTKRLLRSGKAKVHCNEKKSSGACSSIDFVQIYSEKTERILNYRASVKYLVLAVLRNFRVEL